MSAGRGEEDGGRGEGTGRPEAARGPAAGPPVPSLSDPEVLVVGGGPAGSTVAGLLARRGHDVLLVDRATFPRPKPCGECLNPGAVAALERLGLLDAVLGLDPARLAGWSVAGSRSEARGDFGAGLHGLGVPRERLDHALLERARHRGARVREGVRVEEVEPGSEPGVRRGGVGNPAVSVRLPDGSTMELRPRAVVGADGLRSRVARSLSLVGARPRPDRVSLTCRIRWTGPDPAGDRGLRRGSLTVSDGVTLGIAPVDGGGLGNATVVADSSRYRPELAADPHAFVAAVLEARLPPPVPSIVDGPWASGPFRQPVRRAWAPGVVLVGDAAGYFDPFTGQGIYRALRSAELAAEAMTRALTEGGDGSHLAGYHRRWQAELRPRRRVQRVVDAVMRRGWLREPVLDALDRSGLLPPVIRVTGDAAPVSSLFLPSPWAVPGRHRANRR